MKIISWTGTIASIIGAYLLAFGFSGLYAYACFSLGSISWLFVGAMNRDKPLVILNLFFFIANIVGLYRAIIVVL